MGNTINVMTMGLNPAKIHNKYFFIDPPKISERLYHS